jgi:SAM-dependent methyltransferase
MVMDRLRRVREETKKSYDLAAEKYFEAFRDEMKQKEYDRAFLEEFSSSFPPGARVCDAGCGPGHITRYLSDLGMDAFGIDISERCIGIAKRENPGMEFRMMDMAGLEMAGGSIDGIVSFYSIIHTPKRLQPLLFREFSRVLRVGGKVAVVVKKGEGEGYVDELMGFKTRLYFASFSEAEVRGYLETSGFRVELVRTRPPYGFEIPVDRIYAVGVKVKDI